MEYNSNYYYIIIVHNFRFAIKLILILKSFIMRKDEKVKDLLENLLAKHDSYHHHKENTSHVGIILQITFFSGLITFSETSLLKEIDSSLMVISISVIWLLLHIFIRNQLRLKRVAAINYAGCFSAYLTFVNCKFKKIDLKPKTIKGFKSPKYYNFLDNLFPIGRAAFKTDILGTNEYPSFIAKSVQTRYDNFKTSRTRYEWIFTITSIIMLGTMILTILNK